MGKKRKEQKIKENSDEKSGSDFEKAADNGAAEVDELFGKLNKRKKEKREEEEKEYREEEERRLRRKTERKELKMLAARGINNDQVGTITSSGEIISPNPPIHRWDRASGLPVYKCKALKTEDGGGTPLCPFDCNCCF